MKIKLEPELAFSLFTNMPDDCYETVEVEHFGEWRWGNNYRLIIKDLATGKFFAAICQEQSGDHYYNSFEEASSPIEFTEVVPEQTITVKYKDVSNG